MRKILVGVLLLGAAAFAGEVFYASGTSTGGVGVVAVPRGSLFTTQCVGFDVKIILAPAADAGYFDAGAGWYQPDKAFLPSSADSTQGALVFQPVGNTDAGLVTCTTYTRRGDEK